MGPKYNDKCSIRVAQTEENTQRREEGNVKTEAEIEMMWPQVKKYLGMMAATRSWKRQEGFFLEPLKGAWPC